MARVGAIVLAAGRATRFGAQPSSSKVLAALGGQTLVERVVATAIAAGLDPVVVVTGHVGDNVADALAAFVERVHVVRNEAFREGIASSIRRGVHAMPDDVEATFVMLSDMPLVGAETLRFMVERFHAAQCDAVVPTYHGERGNPCLVARSLFARLLLLEGDRGARALFKSKGIRVELCPTNDHGILADVDTPEDLRALEGRSSNQRVADKR